MKKKPASPTAGQDWLIGGGEMGKLIRSLDWSATPLGPRESWPQSLRTIVSLCVSTNFPMAIVWGPQHVQLYNDGYWPICGSKHPQSMGQNFWECWPTSRPSIGAVFEQASAGQTAFIENHCVFLDRNGYLEEAFFTFSFSPIHDESGSVDGLFHPVTELTQQTLAARRLRVLRALAEATADAKTLEQAIGQAVATFSAHTLDLPFVLVYRLENGGETAHLAASTGLAAGSPAATEAVDLAPAGHWPLADALATRSSQVVVPLPEAFGRITAGPFPEPIERAMMLPIMLSGQTLPDLVLIAGVSPRRELDDAYRTFYEMLRDGVTAALSGAQAREQEHKRAEALAAIDRAKTAFFSNVSHEFRTPLTLMIGPLEEALADSAYPLPEIQARRLGFTQRNAQRLLRLVNSLLDFSRIESGRVQAAYVPTDLATYTAELASVFRSAIEKAGLSLVVDCPPLPEPMFVDRDMWEKIVLNLLSNAFKFTFAGMITVRLRCQAGAAVLTVADTGTGVPPEHLPRLFERFHRVPNARCRTFEGSGIGLALVHELVKLHGGTISVDSELDRGTSFQLTIPRGCDHLPAEQIGTLPEQSSTAIHAGAFVEEALRWLPDGAGEPSRRAADADAPPPAQRRQRARILWADDNADMRDYVLRLLNDHWEVEAVADGAEALAAARRNPPDLVLTDIMMPKLDGLGLLNALRADPRTRDIPVVMLSARAGEEAKVEGLTAGADDYLVKPFSAKELLARTRTHLELARLRRNAVEQAQRDPLTDLPNRALALSHSERVLAGCRRGSERAAVFFIDMDRFKPINDTFGHEAGDAVLKEIGRRLHACVRAEDVVGRLGGDEFLVVLAHVHDVSDVVSAARHVIASLGSPYHCGHLELHTTPSIGIAVAPDDGTAIEPLIQNADVAMLEAKKRGVGNFEFFTAQLNERAQLALHIESGLRAGLAQEGELQLHYQPIVDVPTHTVVGVEALLRCPGLAIGADRLIPVAETSGMIDRVGNWVLHEGCRQLRQWRDEGFPEMLLSINLSPLQLRQPRLYDEIADALRQFAIAPELLQLEVNEGSLAKNVEHAIAALQRIKQLGVKIAFDEFGEGRLSLSSLRTLPLDTIKVDQEVVRGLESDKTSMAITEAILGIARSLRWNVIAGGIESAATVALLRDRDCRQMQGYYLGQPMPAADFAAWYGRWQAAGRCLH